MCSFPGQSICAWCVYTCILLFEQLKQPSLLLRRGAGSVTSIGMMFGIESSLEEYRTGIFLVAFRPRGVAATEILAVGSTTTHNGKKEKEDKEETLLYEYHYEELLGQRIIPQRII